VTHTNYTALDRLRGPSASSQAALARMRATRRRDTPAEVTIRRLLHARGLRFRVDCRVVDGTRRRADIAFSRAKVAVFIDGCFWHSCPRHGTRPKANAAWWTAKLDENCRRDADTTARLRKANWHVVRVWEHQVGPAVADQIARIVFVRKRKHDRGSSSTLAGSRQAQIRRRGLRTC
jgi:DNA mismatch endonuclease, patch repair protein